MKIDKTEKHVSSVVVHLDDVQIRDVISEAISKATGISRADLSNCGFLTIDYESGGINNSRTIYSAYYKGEIPIGVFEMHPGCYSSAKPCVHQKASPSTQCEACKEAEIEAKLCHLCASTF